MISYIVVVQRKGLILCVRFRDSFLQGTKMCFVVLIIKAVNFKDVNNDIDDIALNSKHTKED